MSRRDGALALFVALVVAAGGWWWWTSRTAEPPTAAPLPDIASSEPSPTAARVEARRRVGLDAVPCRASGRVVRESDGTGVADAIVVLHQPRVLAPADPVLQRTDSNGYWSAAELPPGRWNVSASAGALAPAVLRGLELEAGKDHGELQLVLADASAELAGRVTDPTGAPIAAARIELSGAAERNTGTAALVGTETDADGRFRVGIAQGSHIARVVHRDYVSTTRHVVVSSDGVRTRDFVLVPGAVIRGRVLARDDGRAIPGAIVRRQVGGGSGFGGMQSEDYENHTAAAADGSFELRGLPAGNVALIASGPGTTSVEATMVALGVAETVEDVELRVEPGYTIAGFVVAADDETTGVGGVTVGVMDFADLGRGRMSHPSASDGFFEVHGLLPGRYTLLMFGDEIVPNMSNTVTVETSDIDDMLVRALLGRRLRGRVEPPGRGVVRLAVPLPKSDSGPALTQLMNRMMSTFRSVPIANDGSFELGPLVPGGYIVEADGDLLRGTLEVDLGERDPLEIVVPMTRGLSLSGTVRDTDGLAVPGVTVSLARSEAPRVLSLSQAVDQGADSTVVADDGRFTIGGFEPGSYIYAVRDDAGMRLPLVRDDGGDPFSPPPLALERDVEVALVVPAARTLRGRVVDESGAPVVGAWVTAWPKVDIAEVQIGATMGGPFANKPSSPMLESLQRQTSRLFALPPVLTDANGAFRITGLRRDSYSLSAHADRGRLQADLADRPPDADVSLVVHPLAELRVELAADDDPGGEIRVRLDGVDTRALSFRSARELVISRLPAGRWHVTVEAPNGVATGELELVAGQTGALQLDLAAWVSVRGRVVDARTGKPQAGIYAIVAAPTETLGDLMSRAGQMLGAISGGSDSRLDADGAFAIGRLPPGKVRISFVAMPTFHSVAVLELDDVRAGESRDVGTVEGIAFEAVPPAEAGWIGLDTSVDREERPERERTIIVDQVERGSPAERIGLRTGDRIVAIDDLETSRFGARVVRSALAPSHLRRGATLRLRVIRDEALLEKELEVAPSNEPAP